MMMYIIMLAAGIALRFSQAEQERAFKIPGGNLGMLIVAGMGILGCLVTIAVGFIPPDNIQVGGTWHYESLLLLGLAITCLPPFLTRRKLETVYADEAPA